MGQIGKWIFIVGIVLAVLAALLFQQVSWIYWVLAILGLIVGILNVTDKETQTFLLAAIGLMLSATALRQLPFLGELLTRIVNYLIIFIAPAVLIVALKSLFDTAKD
jgi:hypothetical protein